MPYFTQFGEARAKFDTASLLLNLQSIVRAYSTTSDPKSQAFLQNKYEYTLAESSLKKNPKLAWGNSNLETTLQTVLDTLVRKNPTYFEQPAGSSSKSSTFSSTSPPGGSGSKVPPPPPPPPSLPSPKAVELAIGQKILTALKTLGLITSYNITDDTTRDAMLKTAFEETDNLFSKSKLEDIVKALDPTNLSAFDGTIDASNADALATVLETMSSTSWTSTAKYDTVMATNKKDYETARTNLATPTTSLSANLSIMLPKEWGAATTILEQLQMVENTDAISQQATLINDLALQTPNNIFESTKYFTTNLQSIYGPYISAWQMLFRDQTNVDTHETELRAKVTAFNTAYQTDTIEAKKIDRFKDKLANMKAMAKDDIKLPDLSPIEAIENLSKSYENWDKVLDKPWTDPEIKKQLKKLFNEIKNQTWFKNYTSLANATTKKNIEKLEYKEVLTDNFELNAVRDLYNELNKATTSAPTPSPKPRTRKKGKKTADDIADTIISDIIGKLKEIGLTNYGARDAKTGKQAYLDDAFNKTDDLFPQFDLFAVIKTLHTNTISDKSKLFSSPTNADVSLQMLAALKKPPPDETKFSTAIEEQVKAYEKAQKDFETEATKRSRSVTIPDFNAKATPLEQLQQLAKTPNIEELKKALATDALFPDNKTTNYKSLQTNWTAVEAAQTALFGSLDDITDHKNNLVAAVDTYNKTEISGTEAMKTQIQALNGIPGLDTLKTISAIAAQWEDAAKNGTYADTIKTGLENFLDAIKNEDWANKDDAITNKNLDAVFKKSLDVSHIVDLYKTYFPASTAPGSGAPAPAPSTFSSTATGSPPDGTTSTGKPTPAPSPTKTSTKRPYDKKTFEDITTAMKTMGLVELPTYDENATRNNQYQVLKSKLDELDNLYPGIDLKKILLAIRKPTPKIPNPTTGLLKDFPKFLEKKILDDQAKFDDAINGYIEDYKHAVKDYTTAYENREKQYPDGKFRFTSYATQPAFYAFQTDVENYKKLQQLATTEKLKIQTNTLKNDAIFTPAETQKKSLFPFDYITNYTDAFNAYFTSLDDQDKKLEALNAAVQSYHNDYTTDDKIVAKDAKYFDVFRDTMTKIGTNSKLLDTFNAITKSRKEWDDNFRDGKFDKDVKTELHSVLVHITATVWFRQLVLLTSLDANQKSLQEAVQSDDIVKIFKHPMKITDLETLKNNTESVRKAAVDAAHAAALAKIAAETATKTAELAAASTSEETTEAATKAAEKAAAEKAAAEKAAAEKAAAEKAAAEKAAAEKAAAEKAAAEKAAAEKAADEAEAEIAMNINDFKPDSTKSVDENYQALAKTFPDGILDTVMKELTDDNDSITTRAINLKLLEDTAKTTDVRSLPEIQAITIAYDAAVKEYNNYLDVFQRNTIDLDEQQINMVDSIPNLTPLEVMTLNKQTDKLQAATTFLQTDKYKAPFRTFKDSLFQTTLQQPYTVYKNVYTTAIHEKQNQDTVMEQALKAYDEAYDEKSTIEDTDYATLIDTIKTKLKEMNDKETFIFGYSLETEKSMREWDAEYSFFPSKSSDLITIVCATIKANGWYQVLLRDEIYEKQVKSLLDKIEGCDPTILGEKTDPLAGVMGLYEAYAVTPRDYDAAHKIYTKLPSDKQAETHPFVDWREISVDKGKVKHVLSIVVLSCSNDGCIYRYS